MISAWPSNVAALLVSGLVGWGLLFRRLRSVFVGLRLGFLSIYSLGCLGRPAKHMDNDCRCLSLVNIQDNYKCNTNIITCRQFTTKFLQMVQLIFQLLFFHRNYHTRKGRSIKNKSPKKVTGNDHH